MMGCTKRNVMSGLLVVGLVVAGASTSYATPPQPLTQDVVYKIHDDPTDPNSPITYTIWLYLTEADADGNSIGWAIDKIRFREVGQGGESDRIWAIVNPAVPTTDGLWWVDHADRYYPQLAEFDDPPHLTGVAAANESGYVDLEYDFQGAPAGTAPWEPTAGLDFELTLAGEATVLASGDDEPVEVGEDEDSPAGGG